MQALWVANTMAGKVPGDRAGSVIRLLIATDAWLPQVNGVVRSIEWLQRELPLLGAEVIVLSPARFRTMPLPTYPEIRLALARPSTIGRAVAAARPDLIHIATEGPVGYGVRRWCLKLRRRFTTSYHTRFPEYVSARSPIPESWVWVPTLSSPVPVLLFTIVRCVRKSQRTDADSHFPGDRLRRGSPHYSAMNHVVTRITRPLSACL